MAANPPVWYLVISGSWFIKTASECSRIHSRESSACSTEVRPPGGSSSPSGRRVAGDVEHALAGVEHRLVSLECPGVCSSRTPGGPRFEAFSSGDYQITRAYQERTLDPDNFYSLVIKFGGPINTTACSNPDVDALIDQAAASTDEAKRQQVYSQIRKTVREEASISIVHYETLDYLMTKDVVGSTVTPTLDRTSRTWASPGERVTWSPARLGPDRGSHKAQLSSRCASREQPQAIGGASSGRGIRCRVRWYAARALSAASGNACKYFCVV